MLAMSAFPNWKKYACTQRRLETGCIPTSYKMMLRAAGAKEIDFDSFQDDFDLDKDIANTGAVPQNNFDSVAEAVRKKYPDVYFKKEPFAKGDGAKKLARVEELIAKGRPVLVSIANAPTGGLGWHIAPIVDSNADELILLDYIDAQGKTYLRPLKKADFVHYHDNYHGGDELAMLESY